MKLVFLSLVFFSFSAFAGSSLSLKDLGFTEKEVKADENFSTAQLEKRHTYLKWHQYAALATLATWGAAIATAKEGGATGTHKALGYTTGALYATAGTLAMLAPKPELTKPEKGPIVWHKRLIYIHLPAMILTPILGAMAEKRYEKGQELKGIEKMHKAVAPIGFAALALSAAFMTFEITF